MKEPAPQRVCSFAVIIPECPPLPVSPSVTSVILQSPPPNLLYTVSPCAALTGLMEGKRRRQEMIFLIRAQQTSSFIKVGVRPPPVAPSGLEKSAGLIMASADLVSSY